MIILHFVYRNTETQTNSLTFILLSIPSSLTSNEVFSSTTGSGSGSVSAAGAAAAAGPANVISPIPGAYFVIF